MRITIWGIVFLSAIILIPYQSPGSSLDDEGLNTFKKAAETDTVSAYEGFLQKYPEGQYSKHAEERIEELHYVNARFLHRIKDYREFLKRYPGSKYTSEIKSYITLLEVVEVMSAKSGLIFIGDSPSPDEVKITEVLISNKTGVTVNIYCIEDEIYELELKAEEKTTIPLTRITTIVFKNYQRAFKPDSYVIDVREKISELELWLEPEGNYTKKLKIIESEKL